MGDNRKLEQVHANHTVIVLVYRINIKLKKNGSTTVCLERLRN